MGKLRGATRAVAAGLVTLWAVLTPFVTIRGTIRHQVAKRSSESKLRPCPVNIFGSVLSLQPTFEKNKRLKRVKSRTRKKRSPLSSRSDGFGDGITFGPWMDFVATAYDGQDDGMNGTASGLTSTGTRPRAWITAAVDPSVITYGTELDVEFANGSHAYLMAEDTGGAIRGDRIDIYIPSREECFKFGRQRVRVRIISRK